MEAVAYYLAKARSGAVEDAFHGLRELGDAALPFLRLAYRYEDDATVRAVIVEAVSQHRRASERDFLVEALQDPASFVWKQALDGLVTLASPETLESLISAHDRETDPVRRSWLAEAVSQAAEAVESLRATQGES